MSATNKKGRDYVRIAVCALGAGAAIWIAIACFVRCKRRTDEGVAVIDKMLEVDTRSDLSDQYVIEFCHELVSLDRLASCGIGIDESSVPLFLRNIHEREHRTVFEFQWYFTKSTDSWLIIKWYRPAFVGEAKFAEARDFNFSSAIFSVDAESDFEFGRTSVKCWQRGEKVGRGLGKPSFILWVNEMRVEFDSREDVGESQFKAVVELATDTIRRAEALYPAISSAVSAHER